MSRDVLRMLTDARPSRLDPDPDAPRADPSALMAYPQRVTGRAARRPVRRLVLAGLVPTVALVAVGAVLLTVGAGGPGSGQGGTLATEGPATGERHPLSQTARDLLLVAAERSQSEPTAGGRYWVVRRENGLSFRVGPADRPYQVIHRTDEEHWLAMRPGEQSTGFVRELGAAPSTDQDRAAWQADGSPTEWTRQGPDGGSGEPVVIKAKPGPKTAAWTAPTMPANSKRVYVLCGGAVTLAELGALPGEPVGLRTWLVDRFRTNAARQATDYDLFLCGRTITADLPVTSEVRAAAYRMLGDLEGVTSLGPVTDQRGRSGTAVAYAGKGDDGSWAQARLIIDPQTGQALAGESWDLGQGAAPASTGTLRAYTLVMSAGYRDTAPPSDGPTS